MECHLISYPKIVDELPCMFELKLPSSTGLGPQVVLEIADQLGLMMNNNFH